MDDVVLSPTEVQRLAGGYKRPGRQLEELHRRGYFRAWRSKVTGEVILERSHYDAVARGSGLETSEPTANRPQVRPPNIRRVK